MPKRAQIEEMLKSDPSDPFLNYALGKALATEGNPEAAVAQFRKLLALAPEHVAAWFQLAQTLAELGDAAAAREVATEGIAVAQRQGDSHAVAEMTGFLELL